MSRWLAFGEPVVVVSISKVRLLGREARLRVAATAYVEKEIAQAVHLRQVPRYLHHKKVRVSILLAERRAVLDALDRPSNRISRIRWIKRRRYAHLLCKRAGIAKWW